ncbi:uncharacterized protein LOC105845666 isoform X6 [Hydra vulgaris]|uniref:uncharacterized protein LOC105845666 isoform X6 n=1 Tax=Hydra vulgaris TaxID=6087 RepID=UPI0032EA394E
MNVNHGDETEVDNDGEDEIYHKRPDKDKALKKYNDYMDEIRKTVSLLVSNTVTTASSSDMTATAVTSFTTTIALTSGSTTTIALTSGTTTIASSSGTTTIASSSGTRKVEFRKLN